MADKSPTGGPDDIASSRQSIRSYCQRLLESGFTPTLFATPEAVAENRDLLLEFASRGVELGLHLHPQSWRDHYLQPDEHDYLGGYTLAEQEQMLREARSQWSDALEKEPTSMRPGNVSANDNTFPALQAAGFRQGSVSQPGRTVPRYHATWAGACPAIHHTHHADRLVAGDMDFVEVPMTTDRDSTDHWTGVGDIRLEDADEDYINRVCRKVLAQQLEQNSPMPHLCLFTHNMHDFASLEPSADHLRPRLDAVISGFREMEKSMTIKIDGATISEAAERFRALTG